MVHDYIYLPLLGKTSLQRRATHQQLPAEREVLPRDSLQEHLGFFILITVVLTRNPPCVKSHKRGMPAGRKEPVVQVSLGRV